MNKLSLYTLLVLLFLGLSKNFSPSEQKTPLLPNEKVLGHFFSGAPLSVILTEEFQIGFLIKTYFMRLKIVHGFKSPEEVIVRTTKEFWENNRKNLGMSIFRRDEKKQQESTIPLPPGSLYIGNLSFGRWRYLNSGEKIWRFHKPYRQYKKVFGWLDFIPSHDFYKKMKIHLKNDRPFYGLNQEFGEKGSITQKVFKEKINTGNKTGIPFKKFYKKFIRFPKWSKTNKEKVNE